MDAEGAGDPAGPGTRKGNDVNIHKMIDNAIATIGSGVLTREELVAIRDLAENMLDLYDKESKQLDELMKKLT